MSIHRRPSSPRGRGGLADLALAYAAGGQDGLAAAAALLGYQAEWSGASIKRSRPLEDERPATQPPPSIAQPEIQAAPLDETPFWRPVQREFRSPLDIPPGVRFDGAATCPSEPPDTTELCRWSALLPRLRATITQQIKGHTPDIPIILKHLGLGRTLARLPRRQRRRWGAGIQIIVDRSRRLVPFQDDQDRMVGRLADLFPHHAVDHALSFDGQSQPVRLDANGNFSDYRTPPEGWLVLVLGDLGCLDPMSKDVTAGWEAFGQRLRAVGCRPIALTPCPPSRWLPDQMPSWTMVPWEQPIPVTTSELEVRTRRLLRLLSPAIRIEPGLLRAIRRLLGDGADAGTEADVWNHRAMIGRSRVAGALAPTEAVRLREDLAAEESPALYATVVTLMHRWRGNLAAEVWAEELLNLPSSVQAQLPEQIRANDLPAAAQKFKDLAGQLPRRPGGTAWYCRVHSRASEMYHQQQDQELRAAQYSMYLAMCESGSSLPPPPGFDPALVQAPDLPVRSVPLTQHGGSLLAGETTKGCPLAEVTSRNGLIEVENGEMADSFWKSGIPPSWASAWGRDRYGAWVEFTLDGVTQRMRWCPPGTFLMGTPDNDADAYDDEKPQHEVTLTTGFWLFDTPCTKALWWVVTGNRPDYSFSPDFPVTGMYWRDAEAFLSRLDERLPGLRLGVPSEAQWEYACCAGTSDTKVHQGIAWYRSNSFSSDGLQPVAQKGPNAWGLYDMLGNVWEWCADGPRPYGHEAVIDPLGNKNSPWEQVFRGGSWSDLARNVSAKRRRWSAMAASEHNIGFRFSLMHRGVEPALLASDQQAEPRAMQGETSAAIGLLRLDRGAEAARCALPHSGFRVLTDCERLTFDGITRPDWASAIGRDCFGLWTEIRVFDVTQRMRWISPGRFWMGSPLNEAGRWTDEGPQHQVTLTKGFWLFDTPCTQELWLAVMGDNPSYFTSSTRLPIESVSWNRVQTFLHLLNERVPNLKLALPTEAQWEYACRAGDAEGPNLNTVAWHIANSDRETHSVADKAPNAWGLYDMLGNVDEWCADEFQKYGPDAVTDPVGRFDANEKRVIRGGSCNDTVRHLRAAYRYRARPGIRLRNLGFRCARVQE